MCKLYSGSRWAVVRKDLQVIKRNTIPTFRKIVPDTFLTSFNSSDYIAKFKNGSEILFMGENYDKDKDLDRFKGLEVNGFCLEEVNELQQATFYKCIERAGSWIIDNMPAPLVLMTCNPTQNWCKTLFYDPYVNKTLKAPYYYLPSSILDNPFLAQTYINSLKSLPPEIYKRFVEGCWEGTDDPGQLIPWTDLYEARDMYLEDVGTQSLGVDVAGHGKDKTVFVRMTGSNITEIIEFADTSIPEVTAKTKELMLLHGVDAEHVAVDGAGLGAGVIDELEADKIYPINFIGGGKVIEDENTYNYKNLRAQAYWHLKLAFSDHAIGGLTGERIQSDLAAIRYTVEADKQIKIESKEELKKRIGRSPDYADALCYAWWAKVHSEIRSLPGLFVF